MQQTAERVLKDHGFTSDELRQAWNGYSNFSLRDYRVQGVVADATRWRLAQQRAKTAAKRPVPPVQRPGVSQPFSVNEGAVQGLNSRLDRTNNIKDAAALVVARRAARRG
jgi:hypothetical protein